MDATQLLAELQQAFPATRKTGLFPLAKTFDVFKQLGLPDQLSLSSRDGWQLDGDAVTFLGRTEETLLGVDRPSLFIRARPDGESYQVLLGINLPATWRYGQSFKGTSQPILETLMFRSLLLASAAQPVPLGWLRRASEGSPATTDNAPPHDPEPPYQVAAGASLYGWDSKADACISIADLDDLVGQRTLKFALSLVMAGNTAPAAPTEDNPAIIEHLPAALVEDPMLLRRNETWCGLNRQTNSLSHAYLSLYAFGDDGWPICPGVLTLSDVQLRFSTLFPPQKPSINSFSLGARFTLGGIPLLIRGHLPAASLVGGLDPNLPKPRLQPFVKALFGYEISGDMTINRLDFWAQVEQKQYGAGLGLEGDWEIKVGQAPYPVFRRLEVEMQRDKDNYLGSLLGAFRIDKDNEFTLELKFDKGALFRGHWQNLAAPVPFNSLLRALRLPEFAELPGEQQLSMSQASFDFDFASNTFALTFEACLYDPKQPEDSPKIQAVLVAARNVAGTKWGYLCAMDLDLKLHLGLDGIPLAGSLVGPNSDSLRIEQLRLIAATKAVPALPADSSLQSLLKEPIESGLTLAVDLGIGEEPGKTLMVRFGSKVKVPAQAALPAPVVAAEVVNGGGGKLSDPADQPVQPDPEETVDEGADQVGWVDIQRNFGPLHLQRIGFSMGGGALGVLLDAGFDTRGLSIMLSGLQANIPLSKEAKAPLFELAGLAVQYRSPTLNIGGAMARHGPPDKRSYEGELAVTAGRFGVTAMGTYAEVDGEQSFAAYAFIDVPLGGPPCFFVTGLAGGLGFNRGLRLPDIDKVAQFPLIRAAMGSANPDQAKSSLDEYVTIAPGQDWFAAGVRFSSFKMLESFALLTLSFGTRSEIALLGQSTLQLPPSTGAQPALTVVHADLLLKACLQLEEGLLAVNAQLSSTSWLFSRDAHLTGGFAFYLWFGNSPHAGDFVVTLGGYHPQFKVPEHYPQVPRLGLNWKVSNNLVLKGELYFALTPGLIMAGGLLDATWQSSGVRAWFQVQTNFLIRFKPFTYLVSATVSIGVSVEVDLWVSSYTLNARVNANLDLWGPDFGGRALVDLSVVSFTMAFGSPQQKIEESISWGEFRESFLPDEGLIAISAPSGMLGSIEDQGKTLWKVDPANLRVELNHQIPVTSLLDLPAAIKSTWTGQIGVAPMGKDLGALDSSSSVTIRRNGEVDNEHWDSSALLGNLPAGLWGKPGASLQGAAVVEKALLGIALCPKAQVETSGLEVDSSQLQVSVSQPLAFTWSDCQPGKEHYAQGNTLAQLAGSLLEASASSTREGIREALLRQKRPDIQAVELGHTANADKPLFRFAPVLCSLGAP